jgi:hypothetical protein
LSLGIRELEFHGALIVGPAPSHIKPRSRVPGPRPRRR